MTALVLIPARMASTRLPGKPLADIAGKPMIVRVYERAVAAGVGPVAVATDSEAVAQAIRAAGGEAVLTRDDHPSGSDRINEALQTKDPDGAFDTVINLQGDLPDLDAQVVRDAAALIGDPQVDIATFAAEIVDIDEREDPNVVKAIGTQIAPKRLRALYFSRATAPWGEGPLYHHIGIYAWRRAALSRFVGLPPSPLEKRERLEQLRALEAGMRIDIGLVDTVPVGVDTPADLEQARRRFGG
ncbi:3-deoxy-manno-octulosonate cytidylyltransferase [Microbaculum sp. FT89]|uniref:3-deoxy-manno-octulosonate cytidylyltransferase n=1 Tax=Microbaculum sp. FT89 TaxID=3447298 RepID=UPI003F5387DA